MTPRRTPRRRKPARPPMSSHDMQVLGTQLAALTAIIVVALKQAGVPIHDALQSTILSLLVTAWGIVTTIYSIRHRTIDPPEPRPASRHRAPRTRPTPPMINGSGPRLSGSIEDGDTGDIPRIDQPNHA
jgi:hypothetical protein